MNKNRDIVKIFFELSLYLKAFNEDFKAFAYEKAAKVIENLNEEVKDIYFKKGIKGLKEIEGIGNSIALKIEEIIKTGELSYLKELKEKLPVDLINLVKIENLGPKKIKFLYDNLKIKNINDLKQSALNGLIRKLKGFGLRSEQNILKFLNYLESEGNRFILGYIESEIEDFIKKIISFNGVKKIEVVGSYRRKKETIGDLDILIVCQKIKEFLDFLKNITEIKEISFKNSKRIKLKLFNGLEVDLNFLKEDSWGASLIFFTGSKSHVDKLKNLALKNNLVLSEDGLFKGKKKIAGFSEEEIYEALNLQYIPPELREDKGEIELALKKQIPELIKENDLLGDLQIQSNYSDGENSIWDLAQSALKRGLKYIAITDHSKNLKVANGLNKETFKKQWQEIDKINNFFKRKKIDFIILKSIECDILKDGSLDFEDDFLKKFDLVGASIHSYFNLSKEEQTKRLVKAIKNNFVHIIFHPTCRIINKRPSCDLDMEEIIKTALKTNTILEINAFPDRLDLNENYIKKCIDLNIKLAINSDAHNINHFNYLKYGIFQARRGWAKKSDIINTYPLAKMLKMIKK